jgi:hypothetical protein
MVLDKPLAKAGTVVAEIDGQITPITTKPSNLVSLVVPTLILWFLLTTLLLLFYARQNDVHVFTGIFGARMHKWVAYDSALYLDMIEQSKQGAWLLENRFSPEQGTPVYLNSIWVLVGKIGKVTGISSLSAFTVFRFAAMLIFVLALRRFLSEVTDKMIVRNLSILLIVFGGGIGWFFGIAGTYMPELRPWFTEIRSPESNCFLSLLTTPHISLAAAFVLLVLVGYMKAGKGSYRAVWLTCFSIVLLATFHPYDIIMLYLIGAAYVLFSRLKDGKFSRTLMVTYVSSVAASTPVLAYHRWTLLTAPDMRGLNLQNAVPPETSLMYVFALSPLLIFALRQLFLQMASFRLLSAGHLLVVTWALVIPLMVYSYPDVSFAWKLGIGMQVPLYILAAEWIDRRLSYEKQRGEAKRMRAFSRTTSWIAAAIAISLVSSITTLAAMTKVALDRAFPYFLEAEDVAAMQWLADKGEGSETVLSLRWEGMFMPRYADKRAFMGHAIQSVNYSGKEWLAERLFTGNEIQLSDLQVLQHYGIKWVYYGVSEQKVWTSLRPTEHLQLAYDGKRVQLYQVRPPGDLPKLSLSGLDQLVRRERTRRDVSPLANTFHQPSGVDVSAITKNE